ncbi:hypothetical protein OROGR_017046 [Orobanche gracilis]
MSSPSGSSEPAAQCGVSSISGSAVLVPPVITSTPVASSFLPFDVLGFSELGAKVLSSSDQELLKSKIGGIFDGGSIVPLEPVAGSGVRFGPISRAGRDPRVNQAVAPCPFPPSGAVPSPASALPGMSLSFGFPGSDDSGRLGLAASPNSIRFAVPVVDNGLSGIGVASPMLGSLGCLDSHLGCTLDKSCYPVSPEYEIVSPVNSSVIKSSLVNNGIGSSNVNFSDSMNFGSVPVQLSSGLPFPPVVVGANFAKSRKLRYIKPDFHNGDIIVKPPARVGIEGAKEWMFTLVGYFLGKAPVLLQIKNHFASVWKGLQDVIPSPGGFLLLYL